MDVTDYRETCFDWFNLSDVYGQKKYFHYLKV